MKITYPRKVFEGRIMMFVDVKWIIPALRSGLNTESYYRVHSKSPAPCLQGHTACDEM